MTQNKNNPMSTNNLLDQIAALGKSDADLRAHIDAQLSELLKKSEEFERLKARVESLEAVKADLERTIAKESMQHGTTYGHLCKFLDEKEGEFDENGNFSSLEICQDYIQAAVWCERKFGRVNNRVLEAQIWLNDQRI